jgi:hypothetical protein
MKMTNNEKATGTSNRIPASLQQVFLASNGGKEVHKPPPSNVAFQTFRRIFKRPSSRVTTANNNNWKSDTDTVIGGTSETDGSVVDTVHSSYGNIDTVETAPANCNDQKDDELINDREPQDILDGLLYSRKYSTEPYYAKESGYYNRPSALQQASYTSHMIQLVKNNEVAAFEKILSSGLVSPNPANAYGESLLHMACRRGHTELLCVMLKHGASIQIADDYGRTPLHDACWAAAPNFALVDLLLAADPRLFQMMDKRGALPLDYVKCAQDKNAWNRYLIQTADTYWPDVLPTKQGPPPLVLELPNSRDLIQPKKAGRLDLAKLVASGHDWIHDESSSSSSLGLAGSRELYCDDLSESDSDEDVSDEFDLLGDDNLLHDMMARVAYS